MSQHRLTVEQLADWGECTTKTMYAYMSGTRDMPFRRLRRVARQMSLIYRDTAAAELLLGSGFCITPKGDARVNGNVDDDISPINECLGDLRRAYREGDRDVYFRALQQATSHLCDLRGEGERL